MGFKEYTIELETTWDSGYGEKDVVVAAECSVNTQTLEVEITNAGMFVIDQDGGDHEVGYHEGFDGELIKLALEQYHKDETPLQEGKTREDYKDWKDAN